MVAKWHTVNIAKSIPFPAQAGEGFKATFDTDPASMSSLIRRCPHLVVNSVSVS